MSYLINVYNTLYKTTNYLLEPTEVLLSTNNYKMDNDHFLEYFNNKLEIVDDIKGQGILVLPGGKEIPVKDNPITVGRNDVSEYVEFKIGKNPNEVSSQQFTIFRRSSESTRFNQGYDYFIEDRITSVQNKPSTNHTRVNGEDITGQLKKELHDGDKIEFAHMEECVATFQFR